MNARVVYQHCVIVPHECLWATKESITIPAIQQPTPLLLLFMQQFATLTSKMHKILLLHCHHKILLLFCICVGFFSNKQLITYFHSIMCFYICFCLIVISIVAPSVINCFTNRAAGPLYTVANLQHNCNHCITTCHYVTSTAIIMNKHPTLKTPTNNKPTTLPPSTIILSMQVTTAGVWSFRMENEAKGGTTTSTVFCINGLQLWSISNFLI